MIDVKVLERARVWSRHIIEFVAYGTAVSFGHGVDSLGEFGLRVVLDDGTVPDRHEGVDTFFRPGSNQTVLR